MSSKKINLKLFGFVAVVIFCVTLLMISVSFAETEDPAPAVPEEQTESQEAVDPQEQTPEVEGEGEAEAEAENEIKAEQPAVEQDAPLLSETNAPQLQIFLSNGTTPATETVDYDYTGGVIKVKTDSLVIVGNPNVSVTDVIEVNEQAAVHNLTLRNVNMNNASEHAGINIVECSQNASFNLNIEGICTYTGSGMGAYGFIEYYIGTSIALPSYNNLYIKGAVGSRINASLSDSACLFYSDIAKSEISSGGVSTATHFCGNLNISIPMVQTQCPFFCIYKNKMFDPCDLYFEDNVQVEASNLVTYVDNPPIETEGSIYLKNNSFLNLYSKSSEAISAVPMWTETGVYSKLVLEDNSSAYLKSSSDDGALYAEDLEIILNTSGVFSCINDNNYLGFELYDNNVDDEPCSRLEVKRGTLYLSGLDSNGNGALYVEGLRPSIPEGASFKGSPNKNASDQELTYNSFFDEIDPGTPNYYSAYVNTDSNERVPAGTVKISYPSAPDPTPEEYISAQTGDNFGIAVALCIVALIASVGYVLSRRLNKNFKGDC